MKEMDEPRKLTGVAALYVDKNFIYYSCLEKPQETEANPHNIQNYCLRQCDHKGKLIRCVYLPSFIRGVGLDQQGFIYVVCTAADAKVYKLDQNMNAVRRTNDEASQYLENAYELLLTSNNYVLVCSSPKFKGMICILDLDLELCYCLNLSINPLAITVLHDKYFFTAKGAIGGIDIDFKSKTYEIKLWKGMKMNDDKENFNKESIFRGICTCNDSLLVTEINGADGRLLCLQCKGNQLRCVAFKKGFLEHCNHNCDKKKCSPVVVTYGSDGYYCSQGYHGKNYHIERVTITGSTITTEKMFHCSTVYV